MRVARVNALLKAGLWTGGRLLAVVALSAGLLVALVGGGLFLGPAMRAEASASEVFSRRPPIVPPMVPEGAREDWAIWSYVEKINQAWGKDWPLVIQWFEDLDRRYPGNPMVLDKLYVSYIEDGKRLLTQGDVRGARVRFEQAAAYDPARGVAQELIEEIDTQFPAAGR